MSENLVKSNSIRLGHIRLGDKLSFQAGADNARYLLDGWSVQESTHRWTEGGCARLQLHLSDLGTQDIILRLECLAYRGDGGLDHQSVDVLVNDNKVVTWTVRTKDWFEAVIPNGLVRDGSMNVTFLISNPSSPADYGLSSDTRKLGLRVFNLEIKDSRDSGINQLDKILDVQSEHDKNKHKGRKEGSSSQSANPLSRMLSKLKHK